MKELKKLSLFSLIGAFSIVMVVLSSCTVNVTPPTPSQPIAHVIANNKATGSLNCAGLLEDGQYFYVSFSLPQAATVEVQASSFDLPPSYFNIYVMTQNQYNNYYQIWYDNGPIGNASFLNEWDLTNYYNNILEEYSLDVFTNQLAAGTYYLVLANNYYQFGRGVYGSAYFSLIAYY